MKKTFFAILLLAALSGAETLVRWDSRAGLQSLDIPPVWPAELQSVQRELAVASGFRPLVAAPKPVSTPFSAAIRVCATNEAGFIIRWIDVPVAVPLDRQKLLGAVMATGAVTNAIAAFRSDPRLAEWWAGNLTYVRGSTNATLMAAALGLDQAAIEDLVLQCRP